MLVTIENLEKQLKQRNLENVYLFYGDEVFLLETIVKKIKNNFGTLTAGINYIKIDMNNIETIISEIQTPAFGYETKLIIVRNARII